ncbi:MAG: TonB-dependent receptor [Pyrinomonadaceae bacterium]
MKIILSTIIISICFYQAFSQEMNQRILRGTVVDVAGLPIENARIVIVPDSGAAVLCQTIKAGKFTCEVNFNEGFTLAVEAQDFSILRRKFQKLQDFSTDETFTLAPASVRETVQVTANRTETRIGETPASVVTVSKAELDMTAAPTIDDALRQVAGFSLFRRTGSRYANPTAQGVSLRGTGASGASRSLVLFDGVPLNDSFGDWVEWSRVSPIEIERIEVLRGGAASLYGDDSLSGTVNIIPREAREKFTFSAEIYGGTQNTFSGSTFFGFKKKGWTADFVAADFQSEGYILVGKYERGLVDGFAGSKNLNLSARIAKNFKTAGNVFFKTSYFGEARTNGTPAQINRTHLREFILGGDRAISDFGFRISDLKFDWRIHGGTQVYDQTFSAVSADRSVETLNRVQRVPSQNVGLLASASGVVFENQTIVAGFETREVRGASDEIGLTNNRVVSLSGAGGRERDFGFFVQDFAKIGSRFVLAASARFDSRRNFAASNSTRTLTGNQTNTIAFPNRNETAFSPQISLLVQATKNLSFFALGSKSFRAPTLNELYRGFRVGSVVTLANENLRAERAANYESGASFQKNKFYLRGNFFWTEISNPIANLTLTTTPNLITRRRQNVGKTQTRGAEVEAETRWKNFAFNVGYLFSDSRVTEFPANRSLENLRVPQTARQQFNFQTRYANRDWRVALQGRASGEQFDDDLNLSRLEPYFQLDVFAAKRLREKLQVFVGIENIFNSRYSVGKTPVRTVSSPTNLRVGVRWN